MLPLCSGVYCFVIPTGKTFHGMTTPAEKLSYSILSLNSQLLRENHGHNSKTGERGMDQDNLELMQVSKQLPRSGIQDR